MVDGFFVLLVFGFIAGIRHGIDIDHIAAITDIVISQPSRAKGLLYCVLYGLGHGIMVIILGLLFLAFGQSLPPAIDIIFGKIVGVTLILLAIYVVVSLVRYGKNFKMKSRWMLVFDAIQFGYHKLLHNFDLSHHHPKHREEKYGIASTFGIGVIHGVGAETPTQIAALAALVGIGRGVQGMLFLLLFVSGIFLSNFGVAYLSSFGYLKIKERGNMYLIIGVLTALFSFLVGFSFLTS